MIFAFGFSFRGSDEKCVYSGGFAWHLRHTGK